MSFEVHVRKRKWIRVMQIVCILISVVILATFASLIRESGSLIWLAINSVSNDVLAFVIGVFVVSLVLPTTIILPISTFYHERRPRIKVNGSDITFYPLWRPAKKVTLSEITSRNVKGDTTGEKIDAAVASALLSPPLAYAVNQKYAEAQQSPKGMTYTYYSGNKKLITISTKRNMENLERFDKMVVDKLEGKPLELEPEMPAAEVQPAKKSKRPLVLAGLIGVICVVAVAATMFIPHTASPSPDLLAGTSWLSGDDNSQWVFGTDKTFHWYQMEGETDDNYFAGTYEFHVGQDAINYLTTELSDYGITERTIKRVISSNSEYTLDNFVCFSCVNQSFMLRGKEQLSEDTLSSYLGFFLQDGTYLDIANMTTGTYYGFTKE